MLVSDRTKALKDMGKKRLDPNNVYQDNCFTFNQFVNRKLLTEIHQVE